jgi:formate hydrogenlyase subunit 6/NADH:ubiquinone oxidoreductase subunit I
VLNIFRRGLKTGIVTTPYPQTPDPAPPDYRGQVHLHPDRCTGNGDCARACPSGAITVERTIDGWRWELNDARCVFCGLCAEVCTSSAVELSTDYELAVKDPADLVTRVEFVAGEGRES